MRVVIAKKLLSTVGGSEMLARSLGEALAARGHEVTLVGLRPAWARPGIPAQAVGPGGPFIEQAAGLRRVYVPARWGWIGAAADGVAPTSLADARALEEAVGAPDVIHSMAREWAGALERIARRTGAAFVETPLAHPGQPLAGGGRTDVSRYRRDDAVIALTEWEGSWYRERGVERVHVTGIGAHADGTPGDPPAVPTVLFVGRKERYKGYHALRAAAPLVWRELPETRFVAIGQRAWHDAWRRAPSDQRWIDQGVVQEQRKAAAYAGAWVMAMPSDHETFGHTYLEAWAAGRPVVAGDIPPLREVVRAGIDGLHARNEPRAVAAAVLRILTDPAGARRMGLAGRQRLLERWTWPRVAERTERAYEEALAYRRRS